MMLQLVCRPIYELSVEVCIHFWSLCVIMLHYSIIIGFVLNENRPEGDPAVRVIQQFEAQLKAHQVLNNTMCRLRCEFAASSYISIILFLPIWFVAYLITFLVQKEGLRFMWDNVMGSVSSASGSNKDTNQV